MTSHLENQNPQALLLRGFDALVLYGDTEMSAELMSFGCERNVGSSVGWLISMET